MRRARAAATIVLVALLVIAGVGAELAVRRAVRRSEDRSDAALRSELGRQARVSAIAVATWTDRATATLTTAARHLEPWAAAPAQTVVARPVLDDATAAAFDAGALTVDRRGLATATSSSLAAVAGQLRSSRALSAVVGGQAAALGDVIEDPLLHVLTIDVAVPLHDARGAVTGAVVGRTRVPDGSLWNVLVAVSGHAGAVLVTPGGSVLDPRDPPVPNRIPTVDDGLKAPVELARGPATATQPVVDYRGVGAMPMVAGAAPLSAAANAGPSGNAPAPGTVAGIGAVVVIARPAASFGTHHRATATASWAVAAIVVIAGAVILLLALRVRRTAAGVDEAKRAFLAITGHELRTPLTVVRGYTDLVATRWDQLPDETRLELVTTVRSQVRTLERLIERLLLGAQMEADLPLATSRETVPVRSVLEAAVEEHGPSAPAHQLVIEAADDLAVVADRKALDTVVHNLVDNAVKYSPAGGTVTLRAEARRRGRVAIIVDDEGIGLPSDTDAIFDKFVQREAVDTRVHDEGGVGLGLYIVRTLVTAMGGSVRAEPRQPRGARLVVVLRRAPAN